MNIKKSSLIGLRLVTGLPKGVITGSLTESMLLTCDRCHRSYTNMTEGHDGLCPHCVSLIKEGVACPPPLVCKRCTQPVTETDKTYGICPSCMADLNLSESRTNDLKTLATAGVFSGSEKQPNISDSPVVIKDARWEAAQELLNELAQLAITSATFPDGERIRQARSKFNNLMD